MFTRDRFYEATMIQQGACNISGIAHALANAACAARDSGVTPANDPAVRLIVHQLAFLTRNEATDESYSALVQATEAGHALSQLFALIAVGVEAQRAEIVAAAE